IVRTASSLPLHRAFDTGLQHRTFPSHAASLLPGLLAATRTGPTPAGDDELANTRISYMRSQPLLPSCWTHSMRRIGAGCGQCQGRGVCGVVEDLLIGGAQVAGGGQRGAGGGVGDEPGVGGAADLEPDAASGAESVWG